MKSDDAVAQFFLKRSLTSANRFSMHPSAQTMMVFENSSFLVLDKPMGWLSIPGRLGKEESRPCLRTYWETESKIRLLTVHRLDFEVSGLLVFAKTEQAHREANRWFEQKFIKKTYEAITELKMPPKESSFLWKSHILKGKKRAYLSPVGKLAETQAEYHGEIKLNSISAGMWKLSPHTGRSHQLRFEMSHQGYPIFGDRLYGASHSYKDNGIALRATELDFSQCSREAFGLPKSLKVKPLSEIL